MKTQAYFQKLVFVWWVTHTSDTLVQKLLPAEIPSTRRRPAAGQVSVCASSTGAAASIAVMSGIHQWLVTGRED